MSSNLVSHISHGFHSIHPVVISKLMFNIILKEAKTTWEDFCFGSIANVNNIKHLFGCWVTKRLPSDIFNMKCFLSKECGPTLFISVVEAFNCVEFVTRAVITSSRLIVQFVMNRLALLLQKVSFQLIVVNIMVVKYLP